MMEQKNKIGNIFVLPWMICRPGHIPYSGKISRTINFTVFEDFTITSKINSSKSHYSIESYDSLVDPRNLIREICRGEITSKVLCLENYPLYGIPYMWSGKILANRKPFTDVLPSN